MARRRELIDQAIRSYGLRVGQACQLFAMSRRVYHYQPKGSDDGATSICKHSRVIAVLEQLITIRGKPKFIRVDNGPEFCALGFQHWAKTNGISIDYIEPGKPAQNAYIERFNRTYREDILDAYVFENLEEVRQLTDQWIIEYNQVRPHQALGDMTPYDYLMQAA